MARKAPPPFRTNPSAIARYFFHDCERFLFFRSATPEHRQRLGLPKPEFDDSPLVQAVLESGHVWERQVVEHLLKGRVVVAPGAGELHTRRLPSGETVRRLRQEKPGRFHLPADSRSAAPVLRELRDRSETGDAQRQSSRSLAMCGERDGRLLRVIDLKRGESLKLTHRVQILLYALELQAVLDGNGHWRCAGRSGAGGGLARPAAATGAVRPGGVPAAPRTIPAPRSHPHPRRPAAGCSLAPLRTLRMVRVLCALPR